MNIVLFEAGETRVPLILSDERAQHILKVLRRGEGDSFDAGEIDGRRGKAIVRSIGEETLELDFDLSIEEPELHPVDLIVGLSRPQTNRKILQEATSLGVRSIRFVLTERGEPSYAESNLWTSGEWRRHIVAGAAQAFTTRIPRISFGLSLEEAVGDFAAGALKVALDNYEASIALGSMETVGKAVALAIGSERGWTRGERALLKGGGYTLAHLGPRPLRTETAVVAGIALLIR